MIAPSVVCESDIEAESTYRNENQRTNDGLHLDFVSSEDACIALGSSFYLVAQIWLKQMDTQWYIPLFDYFLALLAFSVI